MGTIHHRTTKRAGKLTPEVIERICERIAQGQDKTHACLADDVSANALMRACRRDPEIAARVAKAVAAGAEHYRSRIYQAAYNPREIDPKPLQWLAERLHPHTFAEPTKRLEMTGADGAPLGPQVQVIGDGAVRIARQVDVELLEAAARGETRALPESIDADEDDDLDDWQNQRSPFEWRKDDE